jgi:methionyl-tRNA formyltransferase
MNCLFLGYDRKKTRLIKLLEKKGCKVFNIKRKILISDIEKNDLYFSFGYRKIIPKKIIKSAKRPIINLHLSFLPFNRGAHPNFWSFINETPSGVSIHEIDKGVDTGPIIYQKKIKFNFRKNKKLSFKSTYDCLFKEIENLFEKNINQLIIKNYKTKKQNKKLKSHKKRDLPKNIKSWNQKIFSYRNEFL